MIKNIVFDMGNVLILYDARRYVADYTDNAEDADLIMRHLFRSVEWIRMDRGAITQEQAVESVCKRLPERLHKTVQLLFDNWHEDIPPFPEMEVLVEKLKTAGYGIYLLSNTSVKFHEYRRHIPALKHFDGEFISADWGMLKPDPAIYTTFCQHFGLVPSQCFFIDDVSANIEGAMLAGMQGAVFHGDATVLEEELRQAGVEF
ncbi:MAG: HAD family phosphatase [Angelakisella sp.]